MTAEELSLMMNFLSIHANFYFLLSSNYFIERPMNTVNEDELKTFISTIELNPFHMRISQQKYEVQLPSFLLGETSNQWVSITHEHYVIHMKSDFSKLFSYCVRNNINVPFLVVNELNNFCDASMVSLSKEARRILNDENAGGASELSEAFSYEVISQSMTNENIKITLHKTEMQIKYWWNAWKKTDYILKINQDITWAVSVTRAVKYIPGEYTFQDAFRLLNKKLFTVNESTKGVLLEDQWDRQILHVFCQNLQTANVIYSTFRYLQFTNSLLCSNTILFITITHENCQSIYFQKKNNLLPKR